MFFTPGEVAELQEIAESLYQDQFTAYAYTTARVDGLDTRTWVEQDVTLGKVAGRAREGDTNTRTVAVAGDERPVVEGGLHISLTAVLPVIGWEYVCTWIGDETDPALLGRRWRVVDVPAKSYATARRLDVVEIPQEA